MRGYKSFSSVMNNAGKVTHTLSSEGYLQSINATVRGIGSTLSYEYDKSYRKCALTRGDVL